MQKFDVIIVGFGWSAIPLIRELERTGVEFTCISGEGDTVWDALSAAGRLDFDLVSDYQTSFFSFDLVSQYKRDYHPTADEFYAMRQRLQREYGRKVVRDRVIRVDNFADHSLVSTASGNTLKATHVVLATGFQRPISADLEEIDYGVSNRTFVFDTMGDSTNLMISKLAPNNNKIIVRTNGFTPIDKVLAIGPPEQRKIVALSRLEFHNFRYFSHRDFASVSFGPPGGEGDPPFLLADQYPDTVRGNGPQAAGGTGGAGVAGPANGTVITKYWPIDLYSKEFGGNLEDAIARGYLLNDIAMWLWTGQVIVVPKSTPIDLEQKTVNWRGFRRRFDEYIPGGDEHPRLPEITLGGKNPFRYAYRDSFMGVLNPQLNNVYFLGYTRPMIGGSPNISEMQALFIHKMIVQPDFKQRIHGNLKARIAAYNAFYYGNSPPGTRDHVVYYGFYNDELARLMGIDHRPEHIQSLSDMIFYYAFPNDAFKYRIKGEYAVEGMGDLYRRINREYGGFILPMAFFLTGIAEGPSRRSQWQRQTYRHFINDMRYKEPFRSFLERYVQTYRRVTGMAVEGAADPEWDAMAECAAGTRRRLARRVPAPATGKFDEAMQNEIHRLASLLGQGRQALVYTLMQMDAASQKNFEVMLNPPEYDLPFLHP